MIDDDGSGYVIFSSPGHNHSVSIERLAPDLLSSTNELVATLSDVMVESPSLFRRNGVYYATYGSSCCACRAGSLALRPVAAAVPYPRHQLPQLYSTNMRRVRVPYLPPLIFCNIFNMYHGHADELVWSAQWWGPSLIPLADGDTAVRPPSPNTIIHNQFPSPSGPLYRPPLVVWRAQPCSLRSHVHGWAGVQRAKLLAAQRL